MYRGKRRAQQQHSLARGCGCVWLRDRSLLAESLHKSAGVGVGRAGRQTGLWALCGFCCLEGGDRVLACEAGGRQSRESAKRPRAASSTTAYLRRDLPAIRLGAARRGGGTTDVQLDGRIPAGCERPKQGRSSSRPCRERMHVASSCARESDGVCCKQHQHQHQHQHRRRRCDVPKGTSDRPTGRSMRKTHVFVHLLKVKAIV